MQHFVAFCLAIGCQESERTREGPARSPFIRQDKASESLNERQLSNLGSRQVCEGAGPWSNRTSVVVLPFSQFVPFIYPTIDQNVSRIGPQDDDSFHLPNGCRMDACHCSFALETCNQRRLKHHGIPIIRMIPKVIVFDLRFYDPGNSPWLW
jgi:hypothetical protein